MCNMLSIFTASLYVGGGSSKQYVGGDSIPSSRSRNSFFVASQVQTFMVQRVNITNIIETNKNITYVTFEFAGDFASSAI